MLEADKFGSYQPKSRETRDAYGILLQMVQSRLGDYPTEILYGAAEEVLTVLKDDNKRVRAQPAWSCMQLLCIWLRIDLIPAVLDPCM